MKTLLLFLSLLLPVSLFGQAVSRAELKATNDLIRAQTVRNQNSWSSNQFSTNAQFLAKDTNTAFRSADGVIQMSIPYNANGVEFPQGATYGGNPFLTSADLSVTNALVARLNLNSFQTNLTYVVIMGDSRDTDYYSTGWPLYVSNRVEFQGVALFTNMAVAGEQGWEQTNHFFANTLSRLPALATNGTNVIISISTGCNDLTVSNLASIIRVYSNFFVFCKSRNYTVVRPTVAVRSDFTETNLSDLFTLNNWFIRNTNLIDRVPDFYRPVPDFNDRQMFGADGIHIEAKGQRLWFQKWISSVLSFYDERPELFQFERIGSEWHLRDLTNGAAVVAFDMAGRMKRGGFPIYDMSIDGSGVLRSGLLAGYGSTASDNTWVGYDTGGTQGANQTGTRNAAFAFMALRDIRDGEQNTAGGWKSMLTATNANRNSSWGYEALTALLSGSDNAAFGYQSLRSLTSAGQNVGVGPATLASVTTACCNVGVGYGAGALVTGQGNTLIGYTAGDNITSGSRNIIIGYGLDAPSATADAQLRIGTSLDGDFIRMGSGSPEGSITAPAGSIFMRSDGATANSSLYVKVSGTGNTGWTNLLGGSASGGSGSTNAMTNASPTTAANQLMKAVDRATLTNSGVSIDANTNMTGVQTQTVTTLNALYANIGDATYTNLTIQTLVIQSNVNHFAASANHQIDGNAPQRWDGTNSMAQHTALSYTNIYKSTNSYFEVFLEGAASGGSDYNVTNLLGGAIDSVPTLFTDDGAAPATSVTLTVTNGTTLELSAKVVFSRGTNFIRLRKAWGTR